MERKLLRKFLIVYLLFFIIFTIITFIYALLLKNEILKISTVSFNNITFIIGIILFLFLGIISGYIAKKNGLLEGFFSGIIIILLVLLLNLIIQIDLKPMFFVKAACYLLSSTSGGIIGVNIWLKKQNK